MGTTYEFDGHVDIHPPLNYAEIKKAQKVALGLLRFKRDIDIATVENVFKEFMPVVLVIEEVKETTEAGIMTTFSASRLEPDNSGLLLSYVLEELVKALPGHAFKGTIVALHPDYLTAEKIVVNVAETGWHLTDVRVVKGESYMHWADDSPSERVIDLT